MGEATREDASISLDRVSTVLGIPKSTLRYWERAGLLQAERGDNNYRRYGSRDVVDVSDVQLLRQAGVPVRDLKAIQDMTPTELESYYRGLSSALGEKVQRLVEAQRALWKRASLISFLELDREKGCVLVDSNAIDAPYGIVPFDILNSRDAGRYAEDPYSMRYVLFSPSPEAADRPCASKSPVFTYGASRPFYDGWILDRPLTPWDTPTEEGSGMREGRREGSQEELLWQPPRVATRFCRMTLKMNVGKNVPDGDRSNLDECFALAQALGRPGCLIARYLLDARDEAVGEKTAFYRLFVELLDES